MLLERIVIDEHELHFLRSQDKKYQTLLVPKRPFDGWRGNKTNMAKQTRQW